MYVYNLLLYTEPISTKQRDCEWEVMHRFEFPLSDFATKSENLEEVRKLFIL